MRRYQLVALAFVVGLAAGIGYVALMRFVIHEEPSPATTVQAQNQGAPADLSGRSIIEELKSETDPQPAPPAQLTQREARFADLFERSSPGVAHIATLAKSQRFYGFQRVDRQQETGSGTGIVIDQQGYILTNYHVVELAVSDSPRLRGVEFTVMVYLSTGDSYEAEVTGVDASNDIALLKIEAEPATLTPLPLGASGSLRVGQEVLAIGSPFGLENTLTYGIISSLGRTLEASDRTIIDEVIQTDAAINPGNSGGPLLNLDGQVIGINTAILSRTGANIGIGFAVPIDTVKSLIPDLVNFGEVLRPTWPARGESLGLLLRQNGWLREVWKLPQNLREGVVLFDIEGGSGLAQAGLREPANERDVNVRSRFRNFVRSIRVPMTVDIVTQIGQTAITDDTSIRQALKNLRAGDSIGVTFFRCDSEEPCQRQQATVTLSR